MKNKTTEVKDFFPALGTDIEISIILGGKTQEDKARADLKSVREEYARLEKMLSRFSPDSELSHLNSNLHFSHEAPHDILEISRRCLDYYKKTKGVFDPRIIDDLERIGYRDDFKKGNLAVSKRKNGKEIYARHLTSDISLDFEKKQITFHARMDFGGIAKGYITDKIAKFLREKGWQNFFVNSGGDIYFSGKDKKEPWYFGVEGIEDEQVLLMASNCGVATSGIVRRKWEVGDKKFHHLINPHSPESFSFDLKTVTVIADTTEEADVWAKVLFLMGKYEGIKHATDKKLKCILLDYRGNVIISPEMKSHIYRK